MEESLSIITIILSLSYISERITNMFKLYLPEKWISSIKPINNIEKKRREGQILGLSLIGGLITSSLFFSVSPENIITNIIIGSQGSENYYIKLIVLIFLSGLLLSFGSRFWHDILDIVLSVKNIKQTSSNQKESDFEYKTTQTGIERFRNLSTEDQKMLIHDFLKEHEDMLFDKYKTLQSLSVRRKKIYDIPQNFYSLHFSILEKIEFLEPAEAIPGFIKYTWKDNYNYSIPTDITSVGLNNLLDSSSENRYNIKLGESCSRKGYNNFGTIGLKVYKNNIPYLLTCYHVICKPELIARKKEFSPSDAWLTSSVVSPGEYINTGGRVIAEVVEGKINGLVDVALAKLTDDNVVINDYSGYGGPEKRRTLTSQDTQNQIPLYLINHERMKTGKLIDHYEKRTRFDITYGNSKIKHDFYGLISTSINSEPGDSGATVVDDEFNVVGMLVGSNDQESYLIPINTIFDTLKLDTNTLKTKNHEN